MGRLLCFARNDKWILIFLLFFPTQLFAIDFGVTGYYRNRAEITQDLDLQTPNSGIVHSNDRFGMIQFNEMRFRVGPIFKINDNLAIYSQMDFLDNIVFGSSANKNLQLLSPVVGTLTLPSGAGTLGEVGGVAGENGSVNVRRAWMEVLTPIGKFKLGRQPSHWGLGIFQNDGDGRQDDFGDSADRLMYITQLNIGNTGALSVGAFWDIPFEAQFDPRIQGFGGTVRDSGQNAKQAGAVLLYEEPNWSAGTFSGARFRSGSNGTTMTATDAKGNVVASGVDGNTLVYFGDVYGRYSFDEYNFQLEGTYIGGKISTGLAINAIPFSVFSSSSVGAGIINLPADQPVRAFLAAFEATGNYDWGGEWNFKSGYASGDASPLSSRITQYGFRPDYRIALMMFDIPMGTSPSLFGGSATNPTVNSKLTGGVPITGNFINNAFYLSLGYKHTLDVRDTIPQADWLKVGGNITTAWAPKKNENLSFSDLLNNSNLPTISEKANSFFSRWYGVEFDVGAEALFFHNLYTAFDAGVLVPGKEYNIDVTLTNPGNIVDPIPPDKASIAFATRFTAMIEF